MAFLENLMWLIIGAVIAFVLENILFELFAGPELRFKTKYLKKRFYKIVRNTPIKTIFVTKTSDLTDKSLDVHKTRKLVKRQLESRGFEPELHGDNLEFDFEYGKTKVGIEIMFAPEPLEEDKLITSNIEVSFTADFGYNAFTGHLLDLKSLSEKIEECVRSAVKGVTFERRSVTCKLKNLYELTGVLSEFEIGTLSAKIGGGYSIDLLGDRIIAYGEINQNLTSVLLKIITVYS